MAATAVNALELAQRFMQLADLYNGAFERLARYEAALWRQVRQTIFTLEALRWRGASGRRWPRQDRGTRGWPTLGCVITAMLVFSRADGCARAIILGGSVDSFPEIN
jgi:hypothetical protein